MQDMYNDTGEKNHVLWHTVLQLFCSYNLWHIKCYCPFCAVQLLE